jgi:molybdate transport system regulatory protein
MKKDISLLMRHWVYVDGQKFFGPGRLELLEAIEETGSIVKAAKTMEMSYKKAWAMVDAMNTQGSQPYVVTKKGGEKGGGAQLTYHARQVIAAYKKLTSQLTAVLDAEKELIASI